MRTIKKIGEGAFGEVLAGHLQLQPGIPPVNVAVKTLKAEM